MPKKKNVYNKERYEENKDEILKYRRERYRCVPNVFLCVPSVFLMCLLKYRRERYRTIHKKDLNISVSTGTFTLYFD